MKDEEIKQIREFNRFYTGVIGLLDNHILDSPFSLPEARVLYELFHQQPCTASALMEHIAIDKGYLSRILRLFEKQGLLTKKTSKKDGRASLLELTARGNKAFSQINAASSDQVSQMLAHLTQAEVRKVIDHMNELKRLINKNKSTL